MSRVRVQDEVLEELRRLPPEPRHALRVAIKALALEQGDIKALTNQLEGFFRLRVGRYRVISTYDVLEGERVITCVSLGMRDWIYEVFQSRLGE